MESIIFLHSLYSPLKVSAITRKCTKMSLLSEGEANKESHRLHWDNSKAGVKRYLWVSSIFLPLGHFQPPAPWCTRPFPATSNPPLATLPFLISREPCSSLFFLLSPFQVFVSGNSFSHMHISLSDRFVTVSHLLFLPFLIHQILDHKTWRRSTFRLSRPCCFLSCSQM